MINQVLGQCLDLLEVDDDIPDAENPNESSTAVIPH
jgi:hypothetical protein